VTVRQESLDLSLSLTTRYPHIRDLLAACVYGSRAGLQGVAADLDRSPSELSRMLNRDQDDPRKLDVDDMVGIIRSTGDTRPIAWLQEKFLADPDERRAQATAQLVRLVPMLTELAQQAGIGQPKARR
jgi:hypothetical protein